MSQYHYAWYPLSSTVLPWVVKFNMEYENIKWHRISLRSATIFLYKRMDHLGLEPTITALWSSCRWEMSSCYSLFHGLTLLFSTPNYFYFSWNSLFSIFYQKVITTFSYWVPSSLVLGTVISKILCREILLATSHYDLWGKIESSRLFHI